MSVQAYPTTLQTDRSIDEVILAETARIEREMPMQRIEPAQFENLFEQRLERYDEDRKLLTTEKEEQEQLSAQLKEANSAFTNARKGDSSTRDREKALQKLENAYVKYNEIVTNLEGGRKFYNGLAKMVTTFRDDCKDFLYQRRLEAGQLENDLSNAMSALNLSQVNSLQDQKHRETLRSQYNAKAPSTEPLTAPKPTRAAVQPPSPGPTPGMWNPDMGIKFGGAIAQQPNGDVHNPAYPNTKARGGQWDINQGVRFA